MQSYAGFLAQERDLSPAAHVRCVGKGRRERCTPSTKQAEVAMKAWPSELPKSINWLFQAQTLGPVVLLTGDDRYRRQ